MGIIATEEILRMNRARRIYKPFLTLLTIIAVAGGGALSVLPAPASAQAEKAAPPAESGTTITPVIDPEANKLLMEMGNTLKSAASFTVQADINYDQVIKTGQQIQYGGSVNLTVERPGRVFAQYEGDLDSRKVWYTGKELVVLDSDKNFYGEIPVSGSIDDAMDSLMRKYGFTFPLADIIYSDPYKAFTTNAAAGVVIGDSMINGQECRHLAFVEKYIDWQIWVSDGAQKLPCKLVITYKTVPGGPQYSAVFSHWSINPAIDASVFTPALKGAERINFVNAEN